jgi:Ca2+-binding RTX toxin-like protein
LNANAEVYNEHRDLFLSPGHRENIMYGGYEELGVSAISAAGYQGYNALVTTHNFGGKFGSAVYVTGVNYTDTDGDNFYSVGESAAGRTVQLYQGATLVQSGTTAAAGGYALSTALGGLHTIIFSGGGLPDQRGASFSRLSTDDFAIKVDLTDGNTIETNTSATLTHNAQHLTLLSFTNINGTGNALANIITGNAGNNVLNGAGGNDTLDGAGGIDTAVYAGNISAYAFSKSGNVYTVFSPDGSMDTVTNVEFFQFDSGTVAAASLPLTGMPQRTVTIINAASSQNEGNSGTTTFTFEIRLNASPFTTQTVNWAAAGSGASPANAADFTGALAGTVSFAPGETSKFVQVTVLGDTTVESNETFTLTLSSPTAGLTVPTPTFTATIVNDDVTSRTVSVSAPHLTIVEGNSGTTAYAFDVSLDQAAATEQSVVYSVASSGTNAADASDFSGALSGTLVFAAGETTKQVLMQITADTTVEANETFAFNLSSPSAGLVLGTASVIAMIVDDDNGAINGTNGSDTLVGTAAADVINGLGGNDVLVGGGGADIMSGHAGNDTYYVDNAADVINEGANEGTRDVVYSSVSYALGSATRVEIMSTISHAATDAINLTGNSFNQEIIGNAGANIIDGGGGTDVLQGLGGNDIYLVRQGNEVIYEFAGGGTDEARAAVSYRLGTGSHVEKLSTIDASQTTAINLTGNNLVQEITGNAGANTLDGGGGADILRGLGGNDTYFVDNAAVTIVETATEGARDIVYASVSYALGAEARIEVLSTRTHSATTAINLTGNSFAQDIIGNAGNNTLIGGGGLDTLQGLGGNDTYYIDHSGARIVERSNEGTADVAYASVNYALWSDSQVEVLSTSNHAATTAINLTGNSFAQTLIGNAGANILDGGEGNDTLQGLGGADTFRFSTATASTDVITDFEKGIDKLSFAPSVATSFGQFNIANNGTSVVTLTLNSQTIFIGSASPFTLAADDFLFV